MSDLSNAIKQICEEKGLDQESVIATIESALSAAYRKDFGEKNQNIKVEFDPETGNSKVFDVKTVVEDVPEEILSLASDGTEEEDKTKKSVLPVPIPSTRDDGKKETEKNKTKDKNSPVSPVGGSAGVPSLASDGTEEERRFNPKTDLQISEAKEIKKTAKVGDEIKTKLEIPDAYGRMAAQTAKQVIVQRLREAEREMIFNEFKDKEKEVVSGVVQRREGRMVLIDLGKTVGFLPSEEQIYGENYNPGERIKVYIKEVRFGPKGSEVILSRTSEEILRKVFYLEIPEISNSLVELKSVAREAGSRSKVAVWTDSDNVDPIGSCVGQRGARIQTIISELGGEKIDIIQYDEDSAKFISNALSPAKVISVETNEEEKKAIVKVQADQLSLAIGKSGQNARLAARLTGWRIDIIEATDPSSLSAESGQAKKDEKKDDKATSIDSGRAVEDKEGKKEKKRKKNKVAEEPEKIVETKEPVLPAQSAVAGSEVEENKKTPKKSKEKKATDDKSKTKDKKPKTKSTSTKVKTDDKDKKELKSKK